MLPLSCLLVWRTDLTGNLDMDQSQITLRAGERCAVSIEEAAYMLGIGRSTAYEAARTGQLPTCSFNHRKVVPIKCLIELLDQSIRETVGEDQPTTGRS